MGSQLALFHSREKFAFLYCLATITGIFCVPGVLGSLSSPNPNLFLILKMTLPLPISSLLATSGTYILNDLVDADLDKVNKKKRPIPSGQVSKKQAWTFVTSTFVTAMLLTAITSNGISIVILTLMLAIGIMYSSPRIALMKRFVVKTGSIAIFYMLCALLGITSFYNLEIAAENPMLVASVLSTLVIMVFISSTLNDMGDVEGDRAAGRKTIPIVIGKENTIKLTKILAGCVLTVTWMFFAIGLSIGHGRMITAISTTAIVLIVLKTLNKMHKGHQESELIRSQHKKLFPLQMAIHPLIIAGTIPL